ncbi:MAG TPA: type II secretion system protein GspC [bacterium]|nr:type II secretion system protein GspC [bacterium]
MYSLRRFDWVLHLATLVACAYFTARGVTHYMAGWLAATPMASTTGSAVSEPARTVPNTEVRENDDYLIIAERNVFNSKDVKTPETTATEVNPRQLGDLGEAVKTSLDVRVTSTMKVRDGRGRRSSAIVATGKVRKGTVYFVGDEESFAPNVKLVKVGRKRIEFINGGRLEFAELENSAAKGNIFAPSDEVFGNISLAKESKGAAGEDKSGSSAGLIYVSQKEVDDALSNLDGLQKEVRIVPNFVNGRIEGFRVLAIRPGGLISKLGVRRGDVLNRVNGEELDIKRGFELFNSLKESKTFSLDVVRGGRTVTLEYEIR